MSTIFQRLAKWLLAPHHRLTNPEKIQRSRLLSSILLVLIVMVLAILIVVIRHDPDDINEPTVRGGFLLLGICALMYTINRLGFTSIPAMGVILPFTAIFIYIPFYSGEDPIFLAFLMIPIILTAIFFSLRWTTITSIGILLLVMNLLSFVDQSMEGTPYWNLRNMLFFLIPATGLVLTFMRHLSNLEHIRQIELRRINEELERKVAELEQFTYTVSHELKNPVVTIKAFLGSVEEDIKRGNLEKARMDFQRISRATDNLHNTLSDLLELSRVGRIVNTFEEFPMAELVQEAIGVVEGRIRSREAVITLAPSLPNVYGDRKRLQEVIENLLDNAIKYTGSQEQPSIEVGMRDGKDATFFVKDNGIGIEPQYRQKIFGLFEKLDSTSEGTGVGLAFIKRIIETHDGKIWVESEGAGKGSTFCFTIPDNRNQ